MPGRMERHVGGTIPAPDTRWADLGASLATGIQKRQQIKEEERLLREKEEREFERELKKLEKQAEMNQELAMLQNIHNMEIYDTPGVGRIEIKPGVYVGPKKETVDFAETMERYDDIISKNKDRAMETVMSAYEGGEIEIPKGVDAGAYITNRVNELTREYLRSEKNFPLEMIPEEIMTDSDVLRIADKTKGKDKTDLAPYIVTEGPEQGKVAWQSKVNADKEAGNLLEEHYTSFAEEPPEEVSRTDLPANVAKTIGGLAALKYLIAPTAKGLVGGMAGKAAVGAPGWANAAWALNRAPWLTKAGYGAGKGIAGTYGALGGTSAAGLATAGLGGVGLGALGYLGIEKLSDIIQAKTDARNQAIMSGQNIDYKPVSGFLPSAWQALTGPTGGQK
jgi:hypothetical protein